MAQGQHQVIDPAVHLCAVSKSVITGNNFLDFFGFCHAYSLYGLRLNVNTDNGRTDSPLVPAVDVHAVANLGVI